MGLSENSVLYQYIPPKRSLDIIFFNRENIGSGFRGSRVAHFQTRFRRPWFHQGGWQGTTFREVRDVLAGRLRLSGVLGLELQRFGL